MGAEAQKEVTFAPLHPVGVHLVRSSESGKSERQERKIIGGLVKAQKLRLRQLRRERPRRRLCRKRGCADGDVKEETKGLFHRSQRTRAADRPVQAFWTGSKGPVRAH